MVLSLLMYQCISRRYIIAVIGLLSFAILNAQRVNITLALEVMTISSVKTASGYTGSGCAQNTKRNSTDIHIKQGTFAWDSKTQGYILSSSFIGFVLTQILGGRFAETLGAKQMLCFSILCASLCNIISPLATAWSVILLIAAQFVKGMAQGLLQPAVSCLMARWYPKEERSFLSSVTYSGFPAGALIGGIVSGHLCDTDMLGGWPAVFYVFGFAGIILAFVAVLLIYNSPEEYDASNNIQLETTVNEKMSIKEVKKLQTPWIQMVLSIPTWALVAGMIGQYWMTFYFISVHTAYLSDVLNLHITENGLFSSLPYILQIIVTWIGSSISDWLTQRDLASTDTVRKYCNTLSCVGFSISMLSVVYAECSVYFNIISFFIAMASIGLGYPGCLTVPMDMTKNFAGTLVGLCGTIASTSGFIIPVIVGHIIDDEGNMLQWCKVIYISIFVVMMSAAAFHFFGSAELQAWDNAPIDDLKIYLDQDGKLERVGSIK